MQYSESHKNKKYVIEGCEILWSLEPSFLSDYAVYIKGTSTLNSLIRSSKRDSNISDSMSPTIKFSTKCTINNIIRKEIVA